jgi:small GTP-binding protein
MIVHGKVVFVGDANVGKTSLINCYQKKYSADVRPTIGAISSRIVVSLGKNGDVELNVWDTAGHEQYKSFAPIFVRGAEVAAIVFDLSKPESFANLDTWMLILDDNCKFVVVGNKCDLTPNLVNERDIAEFMRANPGVPYYCVSAKTGDCVGLLFGQIAEMVSANDKTATSNVTTVPLILNAEPKSKCC